MSETNKFLSSIKPISILDFLFELKKRWCLVAIITISVFIFSLIYCFFLATPLYSSNAKIYVLNKESQKVNSSDLSISTYIAADISEILMDDVILDRVAAELNNKYTSAEIRSSVTMTSPENTRIISITSETASAEDSKKIVDSICAAAQDTLIDIMKLDKIEIIRAGKIAESPSFPVAPKIGLIGLGIGVMLSLAIVFVIFYTDNKLTSSDDVEKYLELKVLASIPYNNHKKINFQKLPK